MVSSFVRGKNALVLGAVLSSMLFISVAQSAFFIPAITQGLSMMGRFLAGEALSIGASYVIEQGAKKLAHYANVDPALLGGDYKEIKELHRKYLQLQNELKTMRASDDERRRYIRKILGGQKGIDEYKILVDRVNDNYERIVRLEKGYWMNGLSLYGGYSERHKTGDVDLDDYSENFDFTTFGLSYRRYWGMIDLEYTPHDTEELGLAQDGDTTSLTGAYIFTQDSVVVPSAGFGLTYTDVDDGEDKHDFFVHGQLNFDLNPAVGVYTRVRYLFDGEYEFGAGVQVPLSIGK